MRLPCDICITYRRFGVFWCRFWKGTISDQPPKDPQDITIPGIGQLGALRHTKTAGAHAAKCMGQLFAQSSGFGQIALDLAHTLPRRGWQPFCACPT